MQMHYFIINNDLAPERQLQRSHVGAPQATIWKHLNVLGHGCTPFSEKLRLDTILEVHQLFWQELCVCVCVCVFNTFGVSLMVLKHLCRVSKLMGVLGPASELCVAGSAASELCAAGNSAAESGTSDVACLL